MTCHGSILSFLRRLVGSRQLRLLGDETDAEGTPAGREGDGDITPPMDSGGQARGPGGTTESDRGLGEGPPDITGGAPDADAAGVGEQEGRTQPDTPPAEPDAVQPSTGTPGTPRRASSRRGSDATSRGTDGAGTDPGEDAMESEPDAGGSGDGTQTTPTKARSTDGIIYVDT